MEQRSARDEMWGKKENEIKGSKNSNLGILVRRCLILACKTKVRNKSNWRKNPPELDIQILTGFRQKPVQNRSPKSFYNLGSS